MIAESPDVSVLIAAYNVTPFIVETLTSVFAQTRGNFEVIVVNDGCPDTVNLEHALAPWMDRIVYLKQPNGGPSVARNTALAAARAPFVALLDADDKWTPDYLETQMAILAANPTADLIYPNMLIFGASPRAGQQLFHAPLEPAEVSLDELLAQDKTVLNCPVIRRGVVLRAG